MRQPRFWLICLALAGLMGCGVVRADELAEVQRLHTAGQTDLAMQRAEKYLAAKPKDAQMRFAVGVMLAETRRNAEAMAAFERLVEDYPEMPEPYNNLATLKAAAGDYEGAKASLDQALRANPNLALAQENMGDVQIMLAMRAYGRVLQIDPSNNSVPAKLALLRQLLKVPARSAP